MLLSGRASFLAERQPAAQAIEQQRRLCCPRLTLSLTYYASTRHSLCLGCDARSTGAKAMKNGSCKAGARRAVKRHNDKHDECWCLLELQGFCATRAHSARSWLVPTCTGRHVARGMPLITNPPRGPQRPRQSQCLNCPLIAPGLSPQTAPRMPETMTCEPGASGGSSCSGHFVHGAHAHVSNSVSERTAGTRA